MKNLKQIEKLIREVALDLEEHVDRGHDGADLMHEVRKLEKAADYVTEVRGGGTGED